MAWQGSKLHGGQRKKPVILLTLLFILASACAALGMSLYGAKVAHTRLWQRLQDQELKITRMQQSMAEVKVEAVDNLTKSSDLEMERDAFKDQSQRTADSLRERDTEVAELKSQIEIAEARVTELEHRLANRQTEAHVLKKALDQYKHQIANLTQELDILRGRMKKAGIIQEAHSILPHTSPSNAGSGDETLKAFAAEKARMDASEAELELTKGTKSAADATLTSTTARKVGVGAATDTGDDTATEEKALPDRDAQLRAKAEAEVAASTRAIN